MMRSWIETCVISTRARVGAAGFATAARGAVRARREAGSAG
jgi:hypothetical protein